MSKQNQEQDKLGNKPNNKGHEGARKPDPETTNTTDPQEHMRGPISSFMQGVKHEAEDNDKDDREEAEKKAAEGHGGE